MFVALLAAATAAAAAPSDAPAPAPASRPVVTQPDWERVPDADALADHYPIKAMEGGVAGKAVISCRVSRKGELNNCTVESEEPAGYGFGNAAIELSGQFRMKPAMVDGKPISNAWIRIPLSFSLPEAEPMSELETLETAIQCYGVYNHWLGRYPTNTILAANIENVSKMAAELARKQKVAPAELKRRLAAAKAAPTSDPEILELCNAPG